MIILMIVACLITIFTYREYYKEPTNRVLNSICLLALWNSGSGDGQVSYVTVKCEKLRKSMNDYKTFRQISEIGEENIISVRSPMSCSTARISKLSSDEFSLTVRKSPICKFISGDDYGPSIVEYIIRLSGQIDRL